MRGMRARIGRLQPRVLRGVPQCVARWLATKHGRRLVEEGSPQQGSKQFQKEERAMSKVKPHASLPARALVLLALLAGIPSPGQTSLASPSPHATAVFMAGTVQAVDAPGRTLDVVTSVGHAVRVVRMQVAGDCEIDVPGSSPILASVKPGAFVRIEYVAPPALARAPVGGIAVTIRAFEIEPGSMQ
jgi:hypothetical protein